MTREDLLELVGDFTWDFGHEFFIETNDGNFIWSDPEYGGNNTIRSTKKSIRQHFGKSHGRDKGKHYIKDYCGSEVKFVG